MNKELLRDSIAVMETGWARSPQDMSASDREVVTRIQAAIDAPDPFDQQALELCTACGWKALIPGDCCLNCMRPNPYQEPIAQSIGNTLHWHEGKGATNVQLHSWPQHPARQYPLPDSLYLGSKDWMAGDYASRVEWLHVSYESKKAEVEMMTDMMLQPVAELTDKQIDKET